jgi:hypothetical protein
MRRVVLDGIVGFLGLAVMFGSLRLQSDLRVWPLSGGLLVAAVALTDAWRPLYVLDAEGILLARTGGGGYPYWRSRLLIRWTSIRDVQRMGEGLLSVGLLDDRWMRLRIGSLSVSDRRRFIDAVKQNACMISADAQFGHWE